MLATASIYSSTGSLIHARFAGRIYEFGNVGRDVQTTSKHDENGVNTVPDEVAHRAAPKSPLRHTRRLSDKVLVAFHQACDTSDLEVAMGLLNILEILLRRYPTDADHGHRRSIEGLVAAHERFWHLRNPAVDL